MTRRASLVLRSRDRPLTRSQQDDLAGRLLVTPTTLVVGLVVLLPFVAVVVLAFQDIRVVEISTLRLRDLEFDVSAFLSVFRSDSFWTSLRTTVIFSVLTSVGSVAAGTAVAIALRKPFPGRGVVRGLVLVPYVLPVVAAVQIWTTLLNSNYGLVNEVGTRFLGWDSPIAFLTTPTQEFFGLPVPVALLTVIAIQIWGTFPLAFLFVTARLMAVPGTLEEAAALDGAGSWQRIRHVVLPQLRGVLLLLLLLRFIWSFQTFNEVYLLTGGAAGTQVLGVRIYNELIGRSNIGSASAVGLAMTAMLAGFIVIYLYLSRNEESA